MKPLPTPSQISRVNQARGTKQWTAPMWALSKGHHEMAMAFLKAPGLDWNKTDAEHNPLVFHVVLHAQSLSGDPAWPGGELRAKELLDEVTRQGINLNVTGKYRQSLLGNMWKPAMVDWCLDHGADPLPSDVWVAPLAQMLDNCSLAAAERLWERFPVTPPGPWPAVVKGLAKGKQGWNGWEVRRPMKEEAAMVWFWRFVTQNPDSLHASIENSTITTFHDNADGMLARLGRLHHPLVEACLDKGYPTLAPLGRMPLANWLMEPVGVEETGFGQRLFDAGIAECQAGLDEKTIWRWVSQVSAGLYFQLGITPDDPLQAKVRHWIGQVQAFSAPESGVDDESCKAFVKGLSLAPAEATPPDIGARMAFFMTPDGSFPETLFPRVLQALFANPAHHGLQQAVRVMVDRGIDLHAPIRFPEDLHVSVHMGDWDPCEDLPPILWAAARKSMQGRTTSPDARVLSLLAECGADINRLFLVEGTPVCVGNLVLHRQEPGISGKTYSLPLLEAWMALPGVCLDVIPSDRNLGSWPEIARGYSWDESNQALFETLLSGGVLVQMDEERRHDLQDKLSDERRASCERWWLAHATPESAPDGQNPRTAPRARL